MDIRNSKRIPLYKKQTGVGYNQKSYEKHEREEMWDVKAFKGVRKDTSQEYLTMLQIWMLIWRKRSLVRKFSIYLEIQFSFWIEGGFVWIKWDKRKGRHKWEYFWGRGIS